MTLLPRMLAANPTRVQSHSFADISAQLDLARAIDRLLPCISFKPDAYHTRASPFISTVTFVSFCQLGFRALTLEKSLAILYMK